MSVGRNLQEMENVVTKGAAAAEPMHNIAQNASGVATAGQTGAWEDLGGPTPENYRPDDDSAALRTPGATLAQVKNVVNAKASAAEPMHTLAKEEVEDEEELVEDEEDLEEGEEEVTEGSHYEGGKKKGKKEKEEDEDKEEDEEDQSPIWFHDFNMAICYH